MPPTPTPTSTPAADLAELDTLWRLAQQQIADWFHTQPSAGATPEDAPSLRELSAAVVTLKRIQDARRAIRLELSKENPQHDVRSEAANTQRIHDAIRLLEQDGDPGEYEEVGDPD